MMHVSREREITRWLWKPRRRGLKKCGFIGEEVAIEVELLFLVKVRDLMSFRFH